MLISKGKAPRNPAPIKRGVRCGACYWGFRRSVLEHYPDAPKEFTIECHYGARSENYKSPEDSCGHFKSIF